MIYKDKEGNTLHRKYSKGIMTVYAKNDKGKLVIKKDLLTMLRRAKIKYRNKDGELYIKK